MESNRWLPNTRVHSGGDNEMGERTLGHMKATKSDKSDSDF